MVNLVRVVKGRAPEIETGQPDDNAGYSRER
jgi:hypothetical protein